MSESQRIAFRQLAKLAERQQGALDALEKALARCRDEPDEVYRQRLDAMSQFLDAFVSGLIQDARDQVALLRGGRGLAQLDRAYGGTSTFPLGQAAPGPNVLFVAVIGFSVGGLAGVLATMAGTLLPSAALALTASRWGDRHRQARGLRAFTAGLAPLTIGLLLATGWILLEPVGLHLVPTLLVVGTVALMMRTKRSPLWAIAAGALAGALGWV
jgi:hypothetical protein